MDKETKEKYIEGSAVIALQEAGKKAFDRRREELSKKIATEIKKELKP